MEVLSGGRELTRTLKPYSLFITHNSFKLEYNISLNNCFMFTLKQFAIIHHQKQLATESGRIKIQIFVDRCQHFKSLHYVYIPMVNPPSTVCVWLCLIGDSQGFLPHISTRQAPHCGRTSTPATLLI